MEQLFRIVNFSKSRKCACLVLAPLGSYRNKSTFLITMAVHVYLLSHLGSFFPLIIFSRGLATLRLVVSVGRSVDRSVGPSHFWIPSSFCIALAKPSATGLPCIRPCSFIPCYLILKKSFAPLLFFSDVWFYFPDIFPSVLYTCHFSIELNFIFIVPSLNWIFFLYGKF